MLILGILAGIKSEKFGDIFGGIFLVGLCIQFAIAFLVLLCLIRGVIIEKRKYRWSSAFVILNIILVGVLYYSLVTRC